MNEQELALDFDTTVLRQLVNDRIKLNAQISDVMIELDGYLKKSEDDEVRQAAIDYLSDHLTNLIRSRRSLNIAIEQAKQNVNDTLAGNY